MNSQIPCFQIAQVVSHSCVLLNIDDCLTGQVLSFQVGPQDASFAVFKSIIEA